MLVVSTFGYRISRKLSRRLRENRAAHRIARSVTSATTDSTTASRTVEDSLRDVENSEHHYRETAPTGSTPITALTLTDVLTDPSLRDNYSESTDDEYLEVDSQWAGPAPSNSA